MQHETFGFFAFFSLLCGMSLFLYGMNFGERGLREISGNRLKYYIAILTRNPVYAVIAGIVITFITQSSSATSVMLVGLTSAGLMTLRQSAGMLLGADIGTTITIQLYSFKIYYLAPLLIAVGYVFYGFSSKNVRKRVGQIVMASGLVFFGMKMMSDAVLPLQHNQLFLTVFKASVENPFAAILISAIFTGLVHSSAATITIIMTFAIPDASGHAVLSLGTAIPLVLGANLGTCVTALLAAIRASDEARRVAWAHTMFKFIGVILMLPFMGLFAVLCSHTAAEPLRQIANAHTIFNVLMTVLFLPLLNPFVKMVFKLVPDKEMQDREYQVKFINKNVFHLPSLALGQAAREIVRMSGIVTGMVEDVMTVFIKNTEEERWKVVDTDNKVDFLQEAVVPYLSKLSQEGLTAEQSHKNVQLLAIAIELEQTADVVSKNLMAHAKKKVQKGFMFSEEGWQEIKAFHAKTLIYLQSAVTSFALNNVDMARELRQQKQELDVILENLRQSHLNRLQKGLPETLETTTIHLDLLDDMHKINYHAYRIAALVAGEATGK